MKFSTTLASVCPVLLVLFSSIFSTSFQAPGVPSGKEGCTINVQKTVRFGFKRKQVDGRAFPKEADMDAAAILDEMAAGSLEVCVDAKGVSHFDFHSKGIGRKDLALELSGLEDVVGTMLLPMGKPSPDIASFLRIVKAKGAEIKELGNGTASVALGNAASKLLAVTLVDTRSGRLLGSSVYRSDDGALLAKLVLMPKPGNDLSMSMFVFEHKLGEHSGWVTEVICETSK